MFIGIVSAVYISYYFNQSPWEAAITVGGYCAVLIIFFTSSRFRKSNRYRTLTGFWKYYSISDKLEEYDETQKLSTPRIVKIQEIDGNLQMEGFICDKENIPFLNPKEIDIFQIVKVVKGVLYIFMDHHRKEHFVSM